jgi:hypothetical protein
VLQLHDGRRIYGWPREWPSDPTQGHFLLEIPSWLDGEKEIPLVGVSAIMVNVQDVRWVEFMNKTWESNHGKESVESATAGTDPAHNS